MAIHSKSQLRWALKKREKNLAKKDAALKKHQTKKATKLTADEALNLFAIQQ